MTSQSAAPETLRPRNRTALWLVLILALSAGIFAPTLINGFTYDDPHYARTVNAADDTNPMVAELHPFDEYWHKPMNWGLPVSCRGFRPTTVYSYALVNHWFASGKGDDAAFAHHLLNLILHTLATLLVFFAVRPLTGRTPALIATLVFGVHGLHSGAVAAIVGRSEILAFAFGLAAMLVYTRGLSTVDYRWRHLLLGGSATLLMLSFGAKESAVCWAALIPLFAWVRGIDLRRHTWSTMLYMGIPLIAFLVLRHDTMVTHVAPRGTFWVEHDANPLYYMPWFERAANGIYILAFGLGKLILPFNLSSNYGDGAFTLIHSLFDIKFLASALVFVAILVGALRMHRTHPPLLLATMVFFGATFVTSNIPFPIETIFGDRIFYTAVLAVAIAAAWLAHRLPTRGQMPASIALAAWVVFNATLSVERSIAWHDNMSLTISDLEGQPNSVGVHIDMGNLRLWDFDPAGKTEFEAALRINPRSSRALRILAENSDDARAAELLQRALASPYLVLGTEGRRVHWALGRLHEKAGRHAEARREFEAALLCNPQVPDVRMHLLRETAKNGEFDRFEALLQTGRRLSPDYPYFEMYHGWLLHHRKQHRAAAEVFATILPELPTQVHVVEGWLRYADSLTHIGKSALAREIAIRFQRLTAKFPEIEGECRRLLRAIDTATPPR